MAKYYDVVIIGSGIAGSLIADQLSNSGFQTVVLEAGDWINRDDAVMRYRNNWRHDSVATYQMQPHALYPDSLHPGSYLKINGDKSYGFEYLKAVGGSTWHWGGLTIRYLPADLNMKTNFSVGKDWPVSYEEIEPYYLLAEQEMGISGDSNDDHGSPRSGSYPMPAAEKTYADKVIEKHLRKHQLNVKVVPAARNSQEYEGRPACCGNNSCTPICPIGAKYSADIHVKKAISHGTEFIHNAVAYKININNLGKVKSIDFKNPDGKSSSVTGRYYVLACNAIETPKLLLNSKPGEGTLESVGNSSGMVGRNLMDHGGISVKFLMPEPLFIGRGPQIVSGIVHGRTGKFRSKRAGGYVFINNTIDIQSYTSQIIEQEKDWGNIDKRIEYYASHYGSLGVILEHLPDPDNRIKLSEKDFDSIGIAKPEVNYNFDKYTIEGAKYFSGFFNKIIGYLGAEKVSETRIGLTGVNHIMGTTCMGNDPRKSVVDINCRSFDHHNLFIAGSSVFPTGGTATPTLTIAALSLRLADFLKTELNTI